MKSKEDYLKLVKEKFKMEEDTVIDSADLITKISEYLYSIDNPCADELKLAELSNELKCTLFNLFSDKDYYSNAAELTLGRIVD